jgi:hypothetical protein
LEMWGVLDTPNTQSPHSCRCSLPNFTPQLPYHHPMGAPTSEMHSIDLPRWAEARKFNTDDIWRH